MWLVLKGSLLYIFVDLLFHAANATIFEKVASVSVCSSLRYSELFIKLCSNILTVWLS